MVIEMLSSVQFAGSKRFAGVISTTSTHNARIDRDGEKRMNDERLKDQTENKKPLRSNDLLSGFHLAIGSRDTLRDWADVMRNSWHVDDGTIDEIVDNLDRIAEIIKANELPR